MPLHQAMAEPAPSAVFMLPAWLRRSPSPAAGPIAAAAGKEAETDEAAVNAGRRPSAAQMVSAEAVGAEAGAATEAGAVSRFPGIWTA